MKVLHINCNYIGTALHQTMVEKLSSIGIENKVYVPTYDKSTAIIKPNSNVVVSECFNKWDRVFFDWKQSKIINDIKSKVNVSDYDCIHAYTLFTDGNTAMNMSKKYGIPYVVAVRNTDVNDFFRLMVHLRSRGVEIMQNASAVFFLSEAYRKTVFEKYVPLKKREELYKKTYIIPNGIDDFWFDNMSNKKRTDDKNLNLIYAGRIDRNKNIPTTQKAVDLLRDKGYDCKLTVVGKVADEKLFEEINKHEFTTFISAKPKEQLIDLYRKNDVFVMPSYKETFGLVYAEAMSQGLPVIYTQGQGFDGQFEEGSVGYHVKADDASEIVNAVFKIIDKYDCLRTNCAEKVLKFRWDNIVKVYSEIYTKILDGEL